MLREVRASTELFCTQVVMGVPPSRMPEAVAEVRPVLMGMGTTVLAVAGLLEVRAEPQTTERSRLAEPPATLATLGLRVPSGARTGSGLEPEVGLASAGLVVA